MRVLKFGGTSVGSENQIKKVVSIIKNNNHKIVVISALSGVTNLLSEFIQQSKNANRTISEQIIQLINDRHQRVIHHLFTSAKLKEIALKKLSGSINLLIKYLDKKISLSVEKEIIAQGELLSTMIIYIYMLEQEIDVAFLPALNFMKITKHREPDYNCIKTKLVKELERHNGCKIFMTNGFICKNHKGRIDNLGRGASDFTATIIGHVLHADEIEIWTDIDGIHNNDPRFVENTQAIRHLSFDEASELAYFGAKILHPASITPAQKLQIPILIKNTMNLESEGTLISDFSPGKNLKAISAKDGITTIKIRSGRMMQAYGFLRKVFEVFEKHQTSVDMLTTSEISVAMTIDNSTHLNEIASELSLLGDIEIEKDQSIVCIVGNFEKDRNILIQKIIDGLELIPIRMISFGASKINISMVIDSGNKVEALNLLNNQILITEPCLETN